MTTAKNVAVVAILFAAALTSTASRADATSYEHIDRYAARLSDQATDLHRQFCTIFRNAPHSQHLRADAANVRRLANHVHQVAHSGSTHHLAEDLRDLDQAFHHLQILVSQVDADVHNSYGRGGSLYTYTCYVQRTIARMEDTLHHLQNDVRLALRHDHGHNHHSGHNHNRGHGRNVYVSRYSSPGFTIRAGAFGIRIGR